MNGENHGGVINLEPTIVKRDSFQLIGYHLLTNLQEIGEDHITENMVSRLAKVKDKIVHKAGEHIYVLQVYPMMENFNPFEDYYEIFMGYNVKQVEQVPPEATVYTVEANMYAHLQFQGNRDDRYKAYDFLYNNWLEKNRCTPLGIELEVWDNRKNNTDICIAINK
jgi:AraC family transcriptional regulator